MLQRDRLIESRMAISQIVAGDAGAAVESIHVDHRLMDRVNGTFYVVGMPGFGNGVHVSNRKSN